MNEGTDDDVRVGVIGHGGLLRACSFARPIRGSGHFAVQFNTETLGISRSSTIFGSDSDSVERVVHRRRIQAVPHDTDWSYETADNTDALGGWAKAAEDKYGMVTWFGARAL